ncbi:hypothetical protein B7463_g7048, partial [Scytalidium lignicola]
MSGITVGRYLFGRLKQLGIKSIFGVPGDYELSLLDCVAETGLRWCGNPNELNAGYAADGYARIAGAGAVVTTFGPGELSNLCPTAGSYAEFVPVVHIVGYPTEKAQNGSNIVHHSLGEVGKGKFDIYHQMSKHITCAHTVLHDEKHAAAEIDRLLNAMLYFSQPVYLGIPADIAMKIISPEQLKTPLITNLPANDPVLQSTVVQNIFGKIESASNPIIIVDGGAVRHGIVSEATELIQLTGLPYFVTTMAKGSMPEHLPTFGGHYVGAVSIPAVKDVIEHSDCILLLGNYPCDTNTGTHTTTSLEKCNIIDFQRFHINIGADRFDTKTKYVLQELSQQIQRNPIKKTQKVTWEPYPDNNMAASSGGNITHDYLWPALSRFIRNDDLIVAETGSITFALPEADLRHAPTCEMYNQTVWGSIGFGTASAVGAFLAGKERNAFSRNILITGEGSLQLTIQAFADLIRHEVNPIVFVLNNDGYTVERLIHGLEADYNSIPPWDYGAIFKALGPNYKTKYHLTKTTTELNELLTDTEFNKATYPTLVEIILGRYDAPQTFLRAAEGFSKANES